MMVVAKTVKQDRPLRIFLPLLALLTLIAAPTHAQKAPANPDNLVKIRLVPERPSVKPGEDIRIAIEQTITPGWHTYWRNPGDSGTAPRVKWALPSGFEAGEIEWPVPEPLPYGPLTNYGYEFSVTLLQTLKAPETLPDGPITLEADVEVLVCKEECIPEYGTYALTLNDPAAPAQSTLDFTQAEAALPQKMPWKAEFGEEEFEGKQYLKVFIDMPLDIPRTDFTYLPIEWGTVINGLHGVRYSNPPRANDPIIVTYPRGERPLSAFQELNFVLSYQNERGQWRGYELTAKPSTDFAALKIRETGKAPVSYADSEMTENLWVALAFALLGGLVLNLMPCVFPVLSLKALSLVKISEKSHALARLHGLSYTAGVVLSFVAIAAALIGLKAAGAQIGWGFQLQNPYVVGALTLLLLVIALNMAGAFEIKNPFANTGGKLASGGGLSGSFFTGVLATLVATPCTAPFMAGAIAYALLQSELVALTIFAALGFGLALPYLLLSFIPAFQKRLPRPGKWMETFRRILSIPMFLAALWLGWVLSVQLIPQKHTYEFGAPWSPAALETALATDKPVFVEMTATWCITCKVNHKTSIDIDSTKALFKDKTITYLIGDWTNADETITKYLQTYGRSGVPLYVYYAPPVAGTRPDPKILPQVLTPGIVQQTLGQ
jgi:DsbC/DsbD-like thiol-disulfide interchange protein/cytochrome c biogenesis protein CcdA